MKRTALRYAQGFQVVLQHRRAQAATMVLAAGECEGSPENSHRGSDQWLYVLSGLGRAIVNSRSIPLKAGTLVLIEQGDAHEIRNVGRSKLKTLNVFVPPAYTKSGNELPRGKSN